MNLLVRILLGSLLLIEINPLVLAQTKAPADSTAGPLKGTNAATTSNAPTVAPNYIPPPPNAASLGVFANVPVSLYAGIPTVSVPIYTIKYRDLTLPISLAYHAQGVRVDQEASWVGLGWALNAGRTITRTIRGLDDMLTGARLGYPNLENQDWPFNGQSLGNGVNAATNADAAFSAQQISGQRDTEPDLFYYNFAGYSGKFVLGQAQAFDANTKVAKGILQSADKLDIRCYIAVNQSVGARWEIITPDGVKHSFTTKEYTFQRDNNSYVGTQDRTTFIGPTGADAACLNTTTFGGSSNSGPYPIRYDYANDLLLTNTHKQIGAWYLDTIESPTGAVINLTYDATTYATLSPLMRHEVGQPDVAG